MRVLLTAHVHVAVFHDHHLQVGDAPRSVGVVVRIATVASCFLFGLFQHDAFERRHDARSPDHVTQCSNDVTPRLTLSFAHAHCVEAIVLFSHGRSLAYDVSGLCANMWLLLIIIAVGQHGMEIHINRINIIVIIIVEINKNVIVLIISEVY